MTTFNLTPGNDVFPQPGNDIRGDDLINALGGNDVVRAGTGNDSVNGDAGRDRLFGDGGDDHVNGGDGHDRAWGGTGNDLMTGGLGNDHLWGGAGRDSLSGGDGSNVLRGNGGNDQFTFGTDTDIGFGGTGNDRFSLNNQGGGAVHGEAGTDTVLANISTNLTLYAIDGVERLLINGGIPAIFNAVGTAAQFQSFAQIRDTWALTDKTWLLVSDGGKVNFFDKITPDMKLTVELVSTEGNTIIAGRNDDTLVGNDGDDRLFGRAGSDILTGGAGNDWIDGGKGADEMRGGTGTNVIVFDDPGDAYYNGGGADFGRTDMNVFTMPGDLYGLKFTGTGDAVLTGNIGLSGRGDNEITGGAGNDTISGGTANEVFNGNDRLFGRSGDDTLIGGYGDDFIVGDNGRDTLFGDQGNDILIGEKGRDLLTGGAGNDQFVFSELSDSGPGARGRDRITDFTTGDLIDVSGIDARGQPGNQAFVLNTGGAFSAGEIRQTVKGANLLLEFNTDADAEAEMSLLLLGSGPLSATDFVL